jgi:hypothetical protein
MEAGKCEAGPMRDEEKAPCIFLQGAFFALSGRSLVSSAVTAAYRDNAQRMRYVTSHRC